MSNLKNFSLEQLHAELERREKITAREEAAQKPGAKPEPLENPDWAAVIEMAHDYIDFVASDDYHDDNDFGDYWEETVMKAVYEKDVYKWINKVC